MEIKAIYFYPIKALRPIPLPSATLTPQGIIHDRSYMLFKLNPDSSLVKLQLDKFPQCALFSQELVSSASSSATTDGAGDIILVRYHTPSPPLISHHPLQDATLSVPLVPNTSDLTSIDVDLHGSPASALRMGDPYDTFFSACFGFPTILVHIGSGRRPVLGTFAPPAPGAQQLQQQPSLSSFIKSHLPSITKTAPEKDRHWLTFSDVAPYLITSTSSLTHPSFLHFQTPSPTNFEIMPKFRPNIVVHDPAEPPFAEDFWAELTLPSTSITFSPRHSETAKPPTKPKAKLLLTANCGRCTSLNVSYALGRPGPGPEGKLLATLMKDRRVDPGHKYSPVFGRYAFLSVEEGDASFDARHMTIRLHVGDHLVVTKRNKKRTTFDWPIPSSAAVTASEKPAEIVA
ncbi:hypothetical protein CCHL11_00364 [Colletotrichum chlorophyti]|uniref:MOSC domain-containing protein n=1 Tax=Colletotrichum chlorophyti TaxID=708187 RepID=A0A1Q8RUX4_9PEZI|nr:hypothetical protein CCHL11_00364 [Colletotrichum chlorophyti]